MVAAEDATSALTAAPKITAMTGLSASAAMTWRASGFASRAPASARMSLRPRNMRPRPRMVCPMSFITRRLATKPMVKPTPTRTGA